MLTARRLATTVVAAASATTIVMGGVAYADPPRGVTPRANDVVGVGSDTTQFVVDAFAKAYNTQKPAPANKLYSFDAVKPNTSPPVAGDPIKTKAGCATIARPNGSSAGIAALQASLAAGNGCIDFARSSRPASSTGTENNLVFVPFARDGVTWAAVPSNHTPKTLTPAQLASIYTCSVTNWHQINSSLPSNPIHPFLPQTGSGTRSFFESAIGIQDTSVGSCVNQSVEENNGKALAGDLNALVPYSIARWIAQTPKAQGGRGAEPDIRGGVTLRKINGSAPTVKNAKTGQITLRAAFVPTFLRLVYNVLGKTSSGTFAAKYLRIFGTAAQHGFICQHQTIVSNFGFGKIGTQCGAH